MQETEELAYVHLGLKWREEETTEVFEAVVAFLQSGM